MFARPRPGAMPSHDDILAEYRRLGIRPISGGSGEGDPPADDKGDDGKDPPKDQEPKKDAMSDDTLGDDGKKALDVERKARKDAEKRAKEAEDRIAAIEAAEAQKKDADAAAAGEWEKLAGDRATKLATAETTVKTLTEERDALAAKVTAYEDRDRARIKAGIKDLPDDLAAFDPGDDVPLSQRLTWFDKASDIASKRATDPVTGVKRLPDPLKGKPEEDEKARKAQGQLARAF